MPLRHKSAQKRARQTIKKTERNKQYKALIKGAIKKVKEQKEKASAQTEMKKKLMQEIEEFSKLKEFSPLRLVIDVDPQ